MYDVTEKHKAEVRQGERFGFDKNWPRLLPTIGEKLLKDTYRTRTDSRTGSSTSVTVADYS
jgi:hypothetical protein